MMLPELKRPWEMIGGALAESAVAELLRELGPDHPLRDKNVQAVAERCDCDDVLFTLTEDKPNKHRLISRECERTLLAWLLEMRNC